MVHAWTRWAMGAVFLRHAWASTGAGSVMRRGGLRPSFQ